MAKLVAKVYADALFELGLDNGMLDVVYDEAYAVKDIFLNNNSLRDILESPKLSTENKKELVKDIFSDRLSSQSYGFLMELIEKNRQKDLISILDHLVDKIKEYKKIGRAYITSAYELGDSEKSSIEEKLLATTDYKSFEFVYSVDESLIGGCTIRIKDRIIDSSIKTKLYNIKRDLSRLQIS